MPLPFQHRPLETGPFAAGSPAHGRDGGARVSAVGIALSNSEGQSGKKSLVGISAGCSRTGPNSLLGTNLHSRPNTEVTKMCVCSHFIGLFPSISGKAKQVERGNRTIGLHVWLCFLLGHKVRESSITLQIGCRKCRKNRGRAEG